MTFEDEFTSVMSGAPATSLACWSSCASNAVKSSGELSNRSILESEGAAFEWEERPVRVRVMRWIVIASTDQKRLSGFDAPVATFGTLPAWAPDESGLDYIVTRNGVSNIWRQPLTGGAPVQITHFSTGRIFSFAWSPDGRWLSLASGVSRSDVVLMSRQP